MLINLEIKKCLYVVLAILLATGVLLVLAALGLDIPFFRQAISFLLLTFVPGILILRILRVHQINTAESIVYAVGLSLAFVMFLGLFANELYPRFGISRPISLYPLIFTFGTVILVLAIFAYFREKNFQAPRQPSPSNWLSLPYLFLIILPIAAVLGALLVNYYQNNILLLIFIVLVAVTVALVASGKFIPEEAYPLAVAAIAIALLYQTTATLASSFVAGYDIQAEHLYQSLTMQSGYWNRISPATNLNTALSLMILSPTYQLILNMSAMWVFKIIYPIFFSLVPLALFQAYRQQVGSKRAFLATFFFMCVIYFLGVGNRMIVGELLFALLILLIVDTKLTPLQRSTLSLVFIIALPMSYYSLTYVALFLFIIGYLILLLISNRKAVSWGEKLLLRLGGSPASQKPLNTAPNKPSVRSVFSSNLVILFIVFSLAWYLYTASGAAILAITRVGQHVLSNISEFFNPVATESLVSTAIGADFASVSTSGKGFRFFQYATQLFIVIGFIRLLLRPSGFKFKAEHVALSIGSALILLFCLILPYFSSHLEVERFYHFTLFLLSPICILGGETIWHGFTQLFKGGSPWLRFKEWLTYPFDFNRPSFNFLMVMALGVLIPYFLFNSGFIFEVVKSESYGVVDTPSSEALSGYRVDMKGTNYREGTAITWLSTTADSKLPVYGDDYALISLRSRFYGQARVFSYKTAGIPKNAYIFLRTWNIEKSEAAFLISQGERIRFVHMSFDDLPELYGQIESENLIYNNGGAQVLSRYSGG